MADLDDFDLNDLDSEDSNTDSESLFDDMFNDDSDQNSDESSDFGDFASQSQPQTLDTGSDNKKGIIKQSIIIIAIGLVLVLLSFMVVKWLSGGKQDNAGVESKQNISNVVSQNNSNYTSGNLGNSDGWVSLHETADIAFENNLINSTFTITAISHSVKIVDSEKNLMIKTILTGTLDGIRGTYELEIPYSKGCQLSIGNYFNVEVELGNYNGKQIVGEIKY